MRYLLLCSYLLLSATAWADGLSAPAFSFTPGSVLFAGSSGDPAQSNAKLNFTPDLGFNVIGSHAGELYYEISNTSASAAAFSELRAINDLNYAASVGINSSAAAMPNAGYIYSDDDFFLQSITGHFKWNSPQGTVAAGAGACGTTPGIAGNDEAGRITVGSGANGGVCTLTFGGGDLLGPGWRTNAPVCQVSNQTSQTVRTVTWLETTTTLTITATTTFTAGDVLRYTCKGYQS